MMRQTGLQMEPCVKRLSVIFLSATFMMLVACGSKDTKKSAQPVAQALAPSIQEKTSTSSSHSATAEPQQQATPESTQTPEQEKADPVPAIIAEAEKAYETGQTDYKA